MKKKKEKDTSNPKYIFPNFLAKAMSKVDMRTQYEASMLSMTFILFGIIATSIYFVITLDLATWYKVFLVLNALAGFLFISSFLITTYQQYKTYMIAYNFQKQTEGGEEDGINKKETKETRS